MGLMQKAIETFDAMSYRIGKEYDNEKEPLAPIGHIIAKAQIEITIDAEGQFVSAQSVDKKIVIPVTEESMGRTSAPVAHPLCEQIAFLLPEFPEKHTLYLDALTEWCRSGYSHVKVNAILTYIKGGMLRIDLESNNILKWEDGNLKNAKDLVCWNVIGLGENSGPVWTDPTVLQAYTGYYLAVHEADGKQLCMITGECAVPAKQHLKGVFSLNGNAKIISANDKANFTFRGRFLEDSEATSVGYIASQKAHNALKWLVTNQGTVFGGRCFVCWNPHGKRMPGQFNPLFISEEGKKVDPTEYRQELAKVVEGYKADLPAKEGVIIASFDAATTGRLAIAYYNELMGSDFIDRLAHWDSTCCWYHTHYGTSAPALFRIVNFAFGTERSDGKVEVDDKVLAQHMQRLLACRVNQSLFPKDILTALVTKAGNLQVYSTANRSTLLFTACACIRKYYIDVYKEEIDMALDTQRHDRSYQFGRLLAVMEKIEQDTYDKTETRETNAVRLQSVFVQRPGYAAKIVMDMLKSAYYPRLKPGARVFYDRLIGEIMEQLSLFEPEEYNKPLTETYLPGYYLQKNALWTKKESATDNNNTETEDEEDEI